MPHNTFHAINTHWSTRFGFFMLCAMVLLTLNGCSSAPKHVATKTQSNAVTPSDLNNTRLVKEKLWSQYRAWKGTPYLYGGNSQKGIDCSAFVQRTFAEKFGYQLPRTTRQQLEKGQKIDKAALKPGDIVFFRTGRNSRHNGIYLGESKFIHASSSKGVTISNLNNDYWKKTYLTSIRLAS